MLKNIIALALLSLTLIIILASIIPTFHVGELIDLEVSVQPNEIKEIFFNPPSVNGTFKFIIIYRSKKPIEVIFIDEEQYWELYGRIDLYGYIYYCNNKTLDIIIWEVPSSTPHWKYYILLNSHSINRIDIDVRYCFKR